METMHFVLIEAFNAKLSRHKCSFLYDIMLQMADLACFVSLEIRNSLNTFYEILPIGYHPIHGIKSSCKEMDIIKVLNLFCLLRRQTFWGSHVKNIFYPFST